MMYQFVASTIGQIADGTHVVIVEPGHARWGEFLAAGPAAWVDPDPTPDPVPPVISPYQAHMALLDAGLLADAELAVATFGPAAIIAWDKATEWRRDSPTIAAIAAALELPPAQLDDLFRAASLITA